MDAETSEFIIGFVDVPSIVVDGLALVVSDDRAKVNEGKDCFCADGERCFTKGREDLSTRMAFPDETEEENSSVLALDLDAI